MKILRLMRPRFFSKCPQITLVTLLAILSSFIPAIADDQSAANQLFVSAVQEWKEANVLSDSLDSNLDIRAKKIEGVWVKLDRIVRNHGGSGLAVKLAIGEQVGPLSLVKVKAALQSIRYQLDLSMCSEGIHEIMSPACLFREALDEVESITLDDYYSEPITFTNLGFAIVAKAQAEAGYFSQALATARRIEDYEFRVGQLGPMADIAFFQARAGLFSQALQTAQSIGDSNTKSLALRRLAMMQAKEGHSGEVLEMMPSIESAYHRSRVWLELGHAQQALGIARSIANNRDRSMILITISKEIGDARLLLEALEAARDIDDGLRRSVAMREVAEAQAEVGWFDKALRTAYEIELNNFRSMALADIGGLLATNGFLTQALDVAGDIGFGSSPDHVRLVVLARQVEAGLISQALDTAFALEELFAIALSFGALGGELKNSSLAAQAFEAARSSNDPFESAQALFLTAAAQARPDLIWKAITSSRSIDPDMLLDMAGEQANPIVLREAFETSRKIEDEFDRSELQLRIAVALNNSGMIKETIEAARGIEDPFNCARALSHFALALSN